MGHLATVLHTIASLAGRPNYQPTVGKTIAINSLTGMVKPVLLSIKGPFANYLRNHTKYFRNRFGNEIYCSVLRLNLK